MNPEPECNCCQPATCEACWSQSSAAGPHVRNRVARPLKYEDNCGPKNCSIFGSHDASPYPASQVKPLKTKNENKNSLGAPIGLVTSNVNFKTEGKMADIMQVRYATYLKAFAHLHLNDEKEWNSQLLDDIMQEGLDLYTASQNRVSPGETIENDIYMSHELDVLREFELSGFTFQIELMPPFQLLLGDTTELGAQGDGNELALEDLIPALRSFLRQHKYGLLKIGPFYAMFWRSREAYFVFDACGRRPTDFQPDKEKGVAMLMCFKSLENIRHLITNLSGLSLMEPLVIRQLKLVKVVTPQGRILQLDYGVRNHQYEIVNDDYAYLKSNLHLTLNKRDILRNRSALPVAVTAIVVSKIDHPATWDLKMLDRIICFGVSFYQARWMKCQSMEILDVNEFPTTFTLGQFHINLDIKDHLYQGTWRCVPDYESSELANALKKAFTDKHYKLILQINYQSYAIWKKQEFIYLLDPYRHRILGKPNEPKLYEQMEKSASVRMFRSFEVFMNVLNHILLDSNRTSPFFLHFVKVKNIQTVHKAKPRQVRAIIEPQRDDDGEILSINEHICFEEAEDLCKAALGESSDYEDDDLRSDVVEIELRTSSSEEEVLEEEEAGKAEIGEMEDVETSSSGEEGGGHKKNVSGSKRHAKGNSAKRKAKKKGGNNRNRKGKGATDNEQQPSDHDKDVTGNKTKQNEKSNDGFAGKSSKEKAATSKENDRKENTDRKETSQVDARENRDLDKNKELDKGKGSKEKDDDSKPMKNPTTSKESTDRKETSKELDKEKATQEKGNKDLVKNAKPQNTDENINKEKETKIKNNKTNEDVNKSVDKDKNISRKDTKENEIIQSFNQFTGDKDLINDKELKRLDGHKEGTEKLNEKSPKERDDKNYKDGTEADDENDECFERSLRASCAPKPNCYPGFCPYPVPMAIVGSQSGSYKSICELLQAGFKSVDRLLLMTPWGNFVVFRCTSQIDAPQKYYYLFDGCTCNFNRFQHFDLSVGTAGLLRFEHLHNIIEYVRLLRLSRSNKKKETLSQSVDDICKEYCNKSFILRV